MIRVLVADDQALVRAGFSVLIDSDPGLEVVGEAANGAEAVELAEATRPDVVLMDIRMPVMDGLEATRQILALDGAGAIRVLDADHVRPGRVRVRRAEGGRERVPAEGHPAGATCWPASRPWRPGRRCSRPA